MNKQKGFIGVGIIIAIIAILALAGGAAYVVKKRMQAPAEVKTNVEGQPKVNESSSSLKIDSIPVYPVTALSQKLKGESMPFEINYREMWQVRALPASDMARPSGDFTQLIQKTTPYAGASPSININAFKADEKIFPYQSAKEFCNASTSPFGLGVVQKSLTINGYDACYSYVNADGSLIDHQYTISNNGYFVQISFREKYTTGSFTGPTTIKTEYDNSYFLPEFKSIAYSIKFLN